MATKAGQKKKSEDAKPPHKGRCYLYVYTTLINYRSYLSYLIYNVLNKIILFQGRRYIYVRNQFVVTIIQQVLFMLLFSYFQSLYYPVLCVLPKNKYNQYDTQLSQYLETHSYKHVITKHCSYSNTRIGKSLNTSYVQPLSKLQRTTNCLGIFIQIVWKYFCVYTM